MAAHLTDAVRRLLQHAMVAYRANPRTVAALGHQLHRLDEPLRVAIAGKVKAGKSTLLNALVGEAIAATDAGECTRVVTWYRGGASPRVVLHPLDGGAVPLPVVRTGGVLDIDLRGTPVERIDRLVVDWPTPSLRELTLIDTPGVASINAENSARTTRFLEPDDETPTEADAVVYLMRHLHVADVRFLESFRDQGVARATSVNTVAVISRADEIAGGRVDAMFSARAIATRYRAEPALRGLCQNVVAVAGLLAFTGRTLRQDEFAALKALAELPRPELDSALLSTDRFLRTGDPALVARFGLFGIRLATSLIRQGAATPAALASELVARSGLPELQRVLRVQFGERRDLLKARSAVLALDRIVRADGDPHRLGPELDRILTSTHEFAELRLLAALRSGAVTLPALMAQDAQRLLGDEGGAPAVRLGLDPHAGPGDLRRAASIALRRWQGNAENPALGRRAADACRVLVRTCEGILARNPAEPVRPAARVSAEWGSGSSHHR